MTGSKQTYLQYAALQVHPTLAQFINDEALPGSGVEAEEFWRGFSDLVAKLAPENQALLKTRDQLQEKLDFYCQQNKADFDAADYKRYLTEIGYLQPEPEDFAITTDGVDPEIATMAGPQLVVPINNARYALNAVNARWGSLYDAAYGTDVIPQEGECAPGKSYNPTRGGAVIQYAREWLDIAAPLQSGSHVDSTAYAIIDGELQVALTDGSTSKLKDSQQFIAYRGQVTQPSCVLLKNNGLHLELQFDPDHPIGKSDPAQLKDIIVEAALTTIMDCEDSVAAVDAEDKTQVYRNWLGLVMGTLSTSVVKGDKTITRTMASDRQYRQRDGEHLTLSGRSLMFVRNVGHLMDNNAILFEEQPIPEGIMDAVITSLIGKHDVLSRGAFKNSAANSIYIVKPKMHGPEEVAFTDRLFSEVETLLGLAANTLKVGIMDEERRTSINLKACIHAAQSRTAFINTGFLDRTGDEIHTSMPLGAFAPKANLKTMPWIQAYEKANVATGLQCGLSGKAQIGKGMWPVPDEMTSMMTAKIAHPKAGANTAWVPSPTAATLHALHYHQVSVASMQEALKQQCYNGVDTILEIPLLPPSEQLSDAQIATELDNNVQGILGYVVRWVHQGVGCSKVPDIHGVGLMEDRATLRISSQHITNWLLHGLVTREQVEQSLEKMAILVDQQNAGDDEYIAMAPDLANSIAFDAAKELIFDGAIQPNGYTEPVLHKKRLEMKQRLAQP